MSNTVAGQETNEASINAICHPINSNCRFFNICICRVVKKVLWALANNNNNRYDNCHQCCKLLTVDDLNGTKADNTVYCKCIPTNAVLFTRTTASTLFDSNNFDQRFIRMVQHGDIYGYRCKAESARNLAVDEWWPWMQNRRRLVQMYMEIPLCRQDYGEDRTPGITVYLTTVIIIEVQVKIVWI